MTNNDLTYKIRISPQVIKGDVFNVSYSGGTAPLYYTMPQVLSGGTGGNSLLTQLSIPILFTQKIDDLGYYTPFDGLITQCEVTNNFLYSVSSTNQYQIQLTNTSNIEQLKFLSNTTYSINWGDNSPVQNFNTFSPAVLVHNYPTTTNSYTITISAFTEWGLFVTQKRVNTPFNTSATVTNPLGTFGPMNYITQLDGQNTVAQQTSNNFTTVPFTITGTSYSRLGDLAQYGAVKYVIGKQVELPSGSIGVYLGVATGFITAYTVDNIVFRDFPNGTTTYSIPSSGLIPEMLTEEPITKDEAMIGVVMEAEVQTNVYIERGNNTALERIQRLGEVDNMGDLVRYGYSFFDLKSYN